MDRTEAKDELFGDYFESFNPGDTFPAPICEQNDTQVPGLEGEDDLLGSMSLLEEADLTDLLAEEPVTEFPVAVDEIKVEEHPVIPAPGLPPPAEPPPPAKPGGAGLRIAGFAIDPDLCSVITSSSGTAAVTSEQYQQPGSSQHHHQPNLLRQHQPILSSQGQAQLQPSVSSLSFPAPSSSQQSATQTPEVTGVLECRVSDHCTVVLKRGRGYHF